jgi:MinD superfamily P-loop ATPase
VSSDNTLCEPCGHCNLQAKNDARALRRVLRAIIPDYERLTEGGIPANARRRRHIIARAKRLLERKDGR